ncbi:MAG: hydrolase [Peptostreptococcaceae bacterium]|nr:hydrolase [Peptostreptococcaceae bacterium]
MDKFFDNVSHRVEVIGDKRIPVIESKLRKRSVAVPKNIHLASGIKIFGKRMKAIVFSTDLAIINNTNADAVIAVYPFTPTLAISKAIIENSPMPVFCGVGGGLTSGPRSLDIAFHAELSGAYGVVMNAPATNELISRMRDRIDIPIVITVVSEKEDFEARIRAGAGIFNVSGGADTTKIVRKIRDLHPNFPIIATGGPTEESIRETIEAGANAITYTPPTTGEMFEAIMKKYRSEL